MAVKVSDQSLRMDITVDPHSPDKYRVDGPAYNIDAFYKAFNIQPGSKLYRPENERVNVW